MTGLDQRQTETVDPEPLDSSVVVGAGVGAKIGSHPEPTKV